MIKRVTHIIQKYTGCPQILFQIKTIIKKIMKWNTMMRLAACGRTFDKVLLTFFFHFQASSVTRDITLTKNGIPTRKSAFCCLVYRDQISCTGSKNPHDALWKEATREKRLVSGTKSLWRLLSSCRGRGAG